MGCLRVSSYFIGMAPNLADQAETTLQKGNLSKGKERFYTFVKGVAYSPLFGILAYLVSLIACCFPKKREYRELTPQAASPALPYFGINQEDESVPITLNQAVIEEGPNTQVEEGVNENRPSTPAIVAPVNQERPTTPPIEAPVNEERPVTPPILAPVNQERPATPPTVAPVNQERPTTPPVEAPVLEGPQDAVEEGANTQVEEGANGEEPLLEQTLQRRNFAMELSPEEELGEGVEILEETKRKIEELFPKLQHGEKDPEITWYASNNMIFSLKSVPNLIFKSAMNNLNTKLGRQLVNQSNESRFNNMIIALNVLRDNQLNCLVIPHAKKFEVGFEARNLRLNTVEKHSISLIAEEKINMHADSGQEDLYQLSGLNETAKQLAIFIAKTGFSDVEWRNIPIIDSSPFFKGDRRVALVDLEHMSCSEAGIFGNDDGCPRGLISCLHSEQQMDTVFQEAERQGVHRSQEDFDKIKERRMNEISKDQRLQEFHARRDLLANPGKPIEVGDLTTLELDLRQECYRGMTLLTMEQAVIDVIQEINRGISENFEELSTKNQRKIVLEDESNLGNYNRERDRGNPSKSWLQSILQALVDKGHLYKATQRTVSSYSIQA